MIQYETDWNIEIEKDDEGPTVNVDDEEDGFFGISSGPTLSAPVDRNQREIPILLAVLPSRLRALT